MVSSKNFSLFISLTKQVPISHFISSLTTRLFSLLRSVHSLPSSLTSHSSSSGSADDDDEEDEGVAHWVYLHSHHSDAPYCWKRVE